MENLHLSYDEVVYRIPYRNLQIMMKDKMHTATGDVFREVSEEEYYRIKGIENPHKKAGESANPSQS